MKASEKLGLVLGVIGTGATVVWVVLSLPARTVLVGVKVTDPGGKGVEGAVVQLAGTLQETDPTGIASFNVPPGEYYLEVTGTAYADVSRLVTVAGNETLEVQLE